MFVILVFIKARFTLASLWITIIAMGKWEKISLGLVLILAIFIRIWKIDKVPVSLFGDELDVGYQAYSIIKTGRDYMGNPFPLHFHSLAEWRTPLYLYGSIPTVYLFGISPLGVRLPAAIFGVLGVLAMYLLVRQVLKGVSHNASLIAIVASFLLAISPWHIQYSRAAFEVTELLFLLLLGIYFFLRSIEKNGAGLWLSVLFLILTAWTYSTAKLFTPLFMATIFLIFRDRIFSFPRMALFKAMAIGVVFGIPLIYSTLFGGGAQRFNYLSIFTDPTMEGDVGFARLNDAQVRARYGGGVISKAVSRIIHNKYTFWGERIIDNYFSAFSFDFFFIRGDINLRHSIEGMGQFYKADIIGMLLGIVFFFFFFKGRKMVALILFWILIGVIPSSITRDGANHATRLILILPPFIFLISYGLVEAYARISKSTPKYSTIFVVALIVLMAGNFLFYQHNYWVHNPWYSERWWHAGFKETFDEIRKVEANYDKIIISNANEPPLIFFLAWNHYPPEVFQKGLDEEYISGFGLLKKTGKYYFGQIGEEGFYSLPKYIQKGMLYVAVQREVNTNLIMEPSKVPAGLKLVKAISYPSGEPAYYLFAKDDDS